jgi:hypothetical protein
MNVRGYLRDFFGWIPGQCNQTKYTPGPAIIARVNQQPNQAGLDASSSQIQWSGIRFGPFARVSSGFRAYTMLESIKFKVLT